MMTKHKKITTKTIKALKNKAKLTLTATEEKELLNLFSQTYDVIQNLHELSCQEKKIIYQITGLRNVYREDRVKSDLSFSQEEALANADETYQGYFVVPSILNK